MCYALPMTKQRTAGCLSFALYWAWVFATIISPLLLADLEAASNLNVRLFGSFGLVFGLAVQFFVIPRISVLDSKIHAFVCLFFPVLYSAVLVAQRVSMLSVSVEVTGVLLFLAGASSSLLLSSIGGGFALYPRKDGIVVTCVASSAGALIAVLMSLLDVLGVTVGVGVLIPLSVALFRAAGLVPKSEPAASRRAVAQQLTSYRSLFVFMFCYGVIFGFVIVESGISSVGGISAQLMLATICVPGVVMLVLGVSSIRVDVESLQRVLLAFAIIGLGALLVADGTVQVAFLLLLVVCFGVFDMASLVTIYEIIRENDLANLSTFALARIPSELGIALGWLIGALLSSALPGVAHSSLFAALAVAGLVVIGLALFQRGGEPSAPVADEEAEVSAPSSVFSPKQLIQEIADEYGLSPREGEVFWLLASGRSPKRIGEKLFISESTAKSHCHRIYQKLDVHSQQELLDVVEGRMNEKIEQRWRLMP